MPKQSHAWNKYSHYSVLMPEIATGASTLAMTLTYNHVIARARSARSNPPHEDIYLVIARRAKPDDAIPRMRNYPSHRKQ